MKRHRVGFVLGVALLISACTAVPGAKPTQGAPSPSVQPTPSECFQLSVEGEPKPVTIGELRKTTTDTVVGVFRGYGEPRWNTPDSERPSAEDFQSKPARLVRSVAIEVQGAVRGSKANAGHAITRGGTLGCDTMSYPQDPVLIDGQRYMFFLLPMNDSEGQPSGEFLVTDAWPIGKDHVVKTAQDGDLPLPTAIDAVKNGPKVTAPPSPGEPPETTAGP